MNINAYNVLFLEAAGPASSIFAECLMSRLGRDSFRGFAAGLETAAQVGPHALGELRVQGYPTARLRPSL